MTSALGSPVAIIGRGILSLSCKYAGNGDGSPKVGFLP